MPPINTYDRGDRVRLVTWIGINVTTMATSASAGSTTITVRDPEIAAGYVASDLLRLSPEDPTRRETVTVTSVSGRVVTVSSPIAFDHGPGEPVIELAAATVTVAVRKPNGSGGFTTVSPAPTVTSPSTGQYVAEVTLDTAGEWEYRFVSTGAVEAAGWQKMRVRPDSFS